MVIPCRSQLPLCHLIKLRHLILAGHRPRAIPRPAAQQLASQPAPLINLQQINRNVLRPERLQLFQRLPPTFFRLVRQSRNQIKTDVANPRLAQNRHRPVNVRPPVPPSRRNHFLIHKRLQPKTNPVNPRANPRPSLFHRNRLRISLQRHLGKLRRETFPNRFQNSLQMGRIQQARRPPAKVNRIHRNPFLGVRPAFRSGPFAHLACSLAHSLHRRQTAAPRPPKPIHPRRLQQLPMPSNLTANRLRVRRKPRRRHHSRMKIAIRTLRLTKRHLNVNPELSHRPKTLAHPYPNPFISLCADPANPACPCPFFTFDQFGRCAIICFGSTADGMGVSGLVAAFFAPFGGILSRVQDHLQGRPSMIEHRKPFDSTVQSLKDSLELLLMGSSGQLQSLSSNTSKEATLKITSTQSSRAPIEITLDEDFGAYLKVGKGSIFEIPLEGKRYIGRDFDEDVTSIVSTIISNGFEEDVLISRDTVVGASGIIRRGGRLTKDVAESWRKIGWDLFSKRERERYTYLPC